MPSPFSIAAPTALEYFAALVADDASLPLTEAAIAIALDDYPGLDVQRVLAQIDHLARTLRERLPADAPAVQKLRMLNRYFFQDLGFAGNVNDYYDPDNSFLHRVLETRLGIPISLSVLYIEIAQQIGLQARGVSFPGHFLVKLRIPQGSQPGEVVIDPFSGQSLSRAELDDQLRPYRRQQGLADEEVPLGLFLQAATSRTVLARMLRNLKEIHRASGDARRLLAACHRLVTLVPDDAAERRDRGLAAAEAGQDLLARTDLIAYLEHAPAAADRDEIARRLLSLGSRASGGHRPGRGSPRLH
jgi:regulator of sirC expression with transglutaminase-like and TPR domain